MSNRPLAALVLLLSLAAAPSAWAGEHVLTVSATILARCGVDARAPVVRCTGADDKATYRVSNAAYGTPTPAPNAVLRGTARTVKAVRGNVTTIEF